MKASTKLDPRNEAARFAMSEMANKTKEFTVELHLAAFAVAIALILGFQVRSWAGSLQQFMRRQSYSEINGRSEFAFNKLHLGDGLIPLLVYSDG